MKKLLTTIALALGTLAIATTTHAVHFHPSTDGNFTNCLLLEHYRSNTQAIPGSYLEVNCDFGYVNNEVTVISEHQEFDTRSLLFPGEYSIAFKNLKLPAKDICYYYQKIAGGHSPNWAVPDKLREGTLVMTNLPNMTDLNLKAKTVKNNANNINLAYENDFGSWDSAADERIAIYAAIRD